MLRALASMSRGEIGPLDYHTEHIAADDVGVRWCGPGGVSELRTGAPVLLSTSAYGLVPVLDCRPERNGPPPTGP